jgi:hypothetical protein
VTIIIIELKKLTKLPVHDINADTRVVRVLVMPCESVSKCFSYEEFKYISNINASNFFPNS